MFLGKTLNLTVPLSTQEYKRVLVDYLGNNVNCQGVAYNGLESVLYFSPVLQGYTVAYFVYSSALI